MKTVIPPQAQEPAALRVAAVLAATAKTDWPKHPVALRTGWGQILEQPWQTHSTGMPAAVARALLSQRVALPFGTANLPVTVELPLAAPAQTVRLRVLLPAGQRKTARLQALLPAGSTKTVRAAGLPQRVWAQRHCLPVPARSAPAASTLAAPQGAGPAVK